MNFEYKFLYDGYDPILHFDGSIVYAEDTENRYVEYAAIDSKCTIIHYNPDLVDPESDEDYVELVI
jgi:hypothetical protein